jgi:hypothetical protein
MLLKANVPAVKSAPVATRKAAKAPAVNPPRAYRDFDDYAKAGRFMVTQVDELMQACYGIDDEDKIPSQDQFTHALYVKKFDASLAYFREFDAAREFFERDELYEETKEAKPNLLNCHTTRQLSRRVVSEQVGLLIGSFPNAAPHSPEVYTRMLIEEIYAANPCASVLEATCREIRRTKTFVPAIAEVMQVLQKNAEEWRERLEVFDDDIAAWHRDIDKALAHWSAKEAVEVKAYERGCQDIAAIRKLGPLDRHPEVPEEFGKGRLREAFICGRRGQQFITMTGERLKPRTAMEGR